MDLPKNVFNLESSEPAAVEYTSYEQALDNLKRSMIESAYNKYGSSAAVARALKISQPKAYRLIQQYVFG